MTITLNNAIASNEFVFGNPTMAYIDMVAFLKDNDRISEDYSYLQNDALLTATTDVAVITNDRYLPPMRAVMLKLKDGSEARETNVTLKPQHTTLNNTITRSAETNISRIKSRSAEIETMTFYALMGSNMARCVIGYTDDANDRYIQGEDAAFIVAGMDKENDGTTPVSPLSIYTQHEEIGMMTDVRENIARIPLAFYVHEDYKEDSITLCISISSGWEKTVYLVDTETDTYYRLMNGVMLTIPTPDNHQTRYYIQGPDQSPNSDVTTEIEDCTTTPAPPSAFQNTDTYDILGRKVTDGYKGIVIRKGGKVLLR